MAMSMKSISARSVAPRQALSTIACCTGLPTRNLVLATVSNPVTRKPESSPGCVPSQVAKASRKTAVVCRVDGGFIGSTTNLIMIASTGGCLAAARFGLAPSAKKGTSAGLKLVERPVDLLSNDPDGFTAADVLAMGSAGHGIGIGIVLGLKGIGAL
eukprot:gene18411-24885_t